MGNFVHHITGGAAASTAVAYVVFRHYHFPFWDAAASGVLCLIASLLPDIDSQESRPNQILFQFLSALAPILLLQKYSHFLQWSELFIAAIAVYIIVGWGARFAFARLTVHRGIFHSIPMALIAGASAFLLYSNLEPLLRHWIASSIVIGYSTHLIIDEVFSFVNFSGESIEPKASFGTALKFSGPSRLATFAVYSILVVLLFLCISNDPLLNGETFGQKLLSLFQTHAVE